MRKKLLLTTASVALLGAIAWSWLAGHAGGGKADLHVSFSHYTNRLGTNFAVLLVTNAGTDAAVFSREVVSVGFVTAMTMHVQVMSPVAIPGR